MDPSALAARVLDFWFGPPPLAPRAAWFGKDVAFDDSIRHRFGDAIEQALSGGLGDWEATSRGALARIVVLDQFTRNAYRDTPRAFAGDALALAGATRLVDSGRDRDLAHVERWFAYLPFEHAEDAAAQARSLVLFERLAADSGDPSPLEWARRHADVIRRFGRYPHRNAVLGRVSTPEEHEFLQQPGSSF